MVFSYGYGQQRNPRQQNNTRQMLAMLIEHIPGFTRSHWMLQSGKCLHHVAVAAAMVDNFSQKH
jgi:hypothetical protein